MTEQYEDSFTFPLTKHLKNVAVDGSAVTVKKLFLSAPCGRNMATALALQEHFMAAIRNVQSKDLNASSTDKKDDKDDSDMSAKSIMMMLSMYGNSSKGLYTDFEELITSGVCFVDPQHKVSLTNTLYEGLSFNDIINLCGEYLYRFLLQSFLGEMS